VGYDTLNEPSTGWIGYPDLNVPGGLLKVGPTPTPFQAMLLGSGYQQEVEVYELRATGPKLVGKQALNPNHQSAWLPGHACLWREHGLWDVDNSGNPHLLRPYYFTAVDGHKVDFNQDYLRPFINRYAAAIREIAPEALIFVESEPGHILPTWGAEDAPRIVSAPHWYDATVLLMKRFNPWIGVDMFKGRVVFGPGKIRKSYAAQMQSFKQSAVDLLGGVPTLIGEVGIPYDLHNKRAYHTGNFRPQVQAMHRSLQAMDDGLMNCTL
jgi:hypothetical protein